jgi:hypothetical protein
MEKVKNIPTHDPYTGELNPYYEELTGQKNPLSVTHKTNFSSLVKNKLRKLFSC